MRKDLLELLHTGDNTLVIENGDVHTFNGRGVADLYNILKSDCMLLKGATVVDKVVGKGAAAIMILGGIKSLYAEVISESALGLFSGKNIDVEYGSKVEQIWNRTHTGRCPVETLCLDALTAEDCLPLITEFITSKKQDK